MIKLLWYLINVKQYFIPVDYVLDIGEHGASRLWMYRETRPSQCNEMTHNEQIPCHAGIYINRGLSLIKNTISPNISYIKVRCINYQSTPLAFTLATNIMQLLPGI
jgi:hypothetical protein